MLLAARAAARARGRVDGRVQLPARACSGAGPRDDRRRPAGRRTPGQGLLPPGLARRRGRPDDVAAAQGDRGFGGARRPRLARGRPGALPARPRRRVRLGVDRDLRPSAHGGRRAGGRHGRRRGLGDAAYVGWCGRVAGGDADGHGPQELAHHRGLRIGRRAGLRPGAVERAVGLHRSRRRLHADAGDRGRPAVRRRVVATGPRPRVGPHLHQPGRRLPHRDRERRRAVAVVRGRAGRAAGAGGDRGEWGTRRGQAVDLRVDLEVT